MSLLLAFALLAAQADGQPVIRMDNPNGTSSTITMEPGPDQGRIDQAAGLIHSGKPGDAIPLLDAVIADNEKRHTDENILRFSARSMMEAIMYGALAATQKKSSIVLDGTWSTAYFLKGFALVDLDRASEAKAEFDKAIGLAPMNAQFLAERGEWHKNRKDWGSAYVDFESASTAAEFSPDESKTAEKGRALRGMAYVRIEQGQLKEAEKLLKQALKLNPNDAGARSELEYIKSLGKS